MLVQTSKTIIFQLQSSIATHIRLLLEMANCYVEGRRHVNTGDKRCLKLFKRVTYEFHAGPVPSATYPVGQVPSSCFCSHAGEQQCSLRVSLYLRT